MKKNVFTKFNEKKSSTLEKSWMNLIKNQDAKLQRKYKTLNIVIIF